MIAIGVVGRKRAGKSIVVDILREQGFEIRATREAVREYILEDSSRGLPDDTLNQQYWGNQARIDNGGDIWMPRLLLKPIIGDAVFDSPRYPDQDEILRKHFGKKYMLLAVDAKTELRYTRYMADKRAGDILDLKGFNEIDALDWNGYKVGKGQNVEGCFALADIIIDNNGTLEDFRRTILEVAESQRSKNDKD